MKAKDACIGVIGVALSFSLLAGAWGDGPFENDDAQDWLSECADGASSTAQAIESALRTGYLEADVGSAAIAAAEVVASAAGPGSVQNSDVEKCRVMNAASAAALASRARLAITKISDPRNSELAQLWAKSKPNRWVENINQLSKRLE